MLLTSHSQGFLIFKLVIIHPSPQGAGGDRGVNSLQKNLKEHKAEPILSSFSTQTETWGSQWFSKLGSQQHPINWELDKKADLPAQKF